MNICWMPRNYLNNSCYFDYFIVKCGIIMRMKIVLRQYILATIIPYKIFVQV